LHCAGRFGHVSPTHNASFVLHIQVAAFTRRPFSFSQIIRYIYICRTYIAKKSCLLGEKTSLVLLDPL
uniref:Uncharacterized protein n=1 Tax=Xenopus tropicalis TaxID=8364 RepID=A0A803JB75_XENTR